MSDLEKRVQILEQELDVLKNQIQSVLLDIQEQLLTNRYPHLRLEDDAPRERAPIPAAPVKSVSLNGTNDDTHTTNGASATGERPPAKPSIIRLVNVNDTEPQQAEAIVTTTADAPTDQAEALLLRISEYEDWAVLKLEKLGLKRTYKLIKVHTKQGRLSPSIAKHLLTFITLFAEHDTITPMEHSEKNKNLVLRLIAGLGGSGSSGARKHG